MATSTIKNSRSAEIDAVYSHADLGSCADESALATALNTKLSAMGNNSNANIRISTTTAFGAFANGIAYIGEIRKGASTSYASVSFYGLGLNADIIGSKTPSGWNFQKEATVDALAKYVSVPANGSKTLTMETYASFMITFHGYTAQTRGALVGVSDTTTISYTWLGTAPSGITITSSGLQMTITNSSAYTLRTYLTDYNGKITVS